MSPQKSDFSVAMKELAGRGRAAWSMFNPIILLVSRNEASLRKYFPLLLRLSDNSFSGVAFLKRQTVS